MNNTTTPENVTSAPPLPTNPADIQNSVLYSSILLSFCLVSIIPHLIFQMGVRRLCGWSSNFSYLALRCISFCSLIVFTTEATVYALNLSFALTNTDWAKVGPTFDIANQMFGAMIYAAYFSIVILNLLLPIQRLFLTILPFESSRILTPTLLKGILCFTGIFGVSYFIITSTPLMGLTFMPYKMRHSLNRALPYTNVILHMNTVSNYVVGLGNLTIYVILFSFLFGRRSIKFQKSSQMRMTIQVFAMSCCEFILYLYWTYIEPLLDLHASDAFFVGSLSNLFFYDVIVVPYLILNRSIQSEIRYIWTGVEASRANTVQVHSKSGLR